MKMVKNYKKAEMVAVLYNIRSLYNVGSIFRTADAVGVSKIYLAGFTPAPVDRLGKIRERFVKTSLGAEKYVKWDDSANSLRSTLNLLERLKSEGYKVFAVEQAEHSTPYYEARLGRINKKVVLVFGNELAGLPQSILKRADKILEIPMRGALVREAHHPRRRGNGKESLNVSTAFGIVAFGLLQKNK